MRIICLIENTAVNEKLFFEEGVSFFVEYNGRNYLIDTGLTGKAVENAKRMRLPINDIDAVVLTHSHLAHTGASRREPAAPACTPRVRPAFRRSRSFRNPPRAKRRKGADTWQYRPLRLG